MLICNFVMRTTGGFCSHRIVAFVASRWKSETRHKSERSKEFQEVNNEGIVRKQFCPKMIGIHNGFQKPKPKTSQKYNNAVDIKNKREAFLIKTLQIMFVNRGSKILHPSRPDSPLPLLH
jgi:hypothetical protein